MEHLILPEEDEVAPSDARAAAVVLGLFIVGAVLGVVEFMRWLL